MPTPQKLTELQELREAHAVLVKLHAASLFGGVLVGDMNTENVRRALDRGIAALDEQIKRHLMAIAGRGWH